VELGDLEAKDVHTEKLTPQGHRTRTRTEAAGTACSASSLAIQPYERLYGAGLDMQIRSSAMAASSSVSL
jgi:hypothetical protein